MSHARPHRGNRPPKYPPTEIKKEEGNFLHRMGTGEKVLASIAVIALIGTFFVPEVRDLLHRPPDVPQVVIKNFQLPAGTLESKEPPTGAEKPSEPSFHVIPMPIKTEPKRPIQRAQSDMKLLPSVSPSKNHFYEPSRPNIQTNQHVQAELIDPQFEAKNGPPPSV